MQLLSFTRTGGEPVVTRKGISGMGVKLIVQIPCLNEEQTLPATLATIPRTYPRHRRRSRSWSSTTAAPTARWRWRARTASTTSCATSATRGWPRPSRAASTPACAWAPTSSSTPTATTSTRRSDPRPDRADPGSTAPTSSSATGRPTRSSTSRRKKAICRASARWVVRKGSGTNVPDAPSGFRAYSREAALRLNVVTRYSYTLETIIQAGQEEPGDRPHPDRRPTRARASRG